MMNFMKKISCFDGLTHKNDKVKQIKPSESIKMLGILFDPAGIKRCMGNFDRELMRIIKAPLKPQQRLKILRSFLIP